MSRGGSRRGYLLALASVVIASVAQLALKLGMSRMPMLSWSEWPQWQSLVGPHLFWLALGLCCYAASLLLWIKVLTHLPLSRAYPILSLSYVLVYLVATSVPALGELATWQRSAGVGFIVLGVLLVSLPAGRAAVSRSGN